MKYLLLILASLALASIGAFIYGSLGPWYDPSPLDAPLLMSTTDPQKFEFSVGRSERYLVEAGFSRRRSKEESSTGASQLDTDVPPGIRWSIRQGGELVAAGSSHEYGASPFRGSEKAGWTIGRPYLPAAEAYTMLVTVESPQPEGTRIDPSVMVRLHPADLEYLIVLKLAGLAGLCLVVPLASIVSILYYRRLRGARK